MTISLSSAFVCPAAPFPGRNMPSWARKFRKEGKPCAKTRYFAMKNWAAASTAWYFPWCCWLPAFVSLPSVLDLSQLAGEANGIGWMLRYVCNDAKASQAVHMSSRVVTPPCLHNPHICAACALVRRASCSMPCHAMPNFETFISMEGLRILRNIEKFW